MPPLLSKFPHTCQFIPHFSASLPICLIPLPVAQFIIQIINFIAHPLSDSLNLFLFQGCLTTQTHLPISDQFFSSFLSKGPLEFLLNQNSIKLMATIKKYIFTILRSPHSNKQIKPPFYTHIHACTQINVYKLLTLL